MSNHPWAFAHGKSRKHPVSMAFGSHLLGERAGAVPCFRRAGRNSRHSGTVPGAKEKTAKHSPVDATAVTSERLLSKYCDKMVTVGRKERQYPRPVNKCQKLP